MFTQDEFDGQMYDPSEHSLISVQVGESSFLQPARQLQWYEPIRLTHDDEDSSRHESESCTHSSTSTCVGKLCFNKILTINKFDIYRLFNKCHGVRILHEQTRWCGKWNEERDHYFA